MFTNDSFNGKGFSAETSKQKKWVMPVESFPRYMRTTDNDWAKDFYCDRVWIQRKGDEYTLKWIVRAYKPTKVQRPAMKVYSKTYPYTADGWFNGYMRWAQIPMRGKDWQKEVQEKLGSFVGKRAESHAYSYAYNEGHSDSRKDDGYNPIKSKQDLVPFKRVLKQKAESHDFSQKSAESFSAESKWIGSHCRDCGEAKPFNEIEIMAGNARCKPGKGCKQFTKEQMEETERQMRNEYPDLEWGAESFEATKGIDTFTEPLEEIGVPKWLIGIGGVVAAITGINYLSKKL